MQQKLQYSRSSASKGFSLFLVLFFAIASNAQPIITSFQPISGAVGTSVTITGNNFSSNTAKNVVFFGATIATVQSATANSLVVTVPAGATYQPISVVSTETNLIGSTTQPFEVTFNTGVGQPIASSFFSAKADFATGNNPAGFIAVADIDGDGKPDVVVVNRSTNTFSILRNTSTLSQAAFANKVDFATDSTPSAVAIADLDGDGKPDIVITNMFTNKISVYRNTAKVGSISASSLAAKVSFVADSISLPTSVAIGDIDGDGKLDLAVVNSFNNTVSVLKNTSTVGNIDASSFAAAVDFTTGLGPTFVAIADVDGDGKLDLVVSNLNAKTISILHNKGIANSIDTTSFAAKVDFTVGTGPNALAIGDLNNDGKPDIIVANQGSNTLSVLRNTATAGAIMAASFAAKFDLPSNGASPYFVAVGNVDSDSIPDIVVANLISNTVSAIKNNYTTGTFSAASFDAGVSFATGTYPFSAAIADVDGDGKADLVVPDYGKNTISVFHNAGSTDLPVSFLSFTGKYQTSGSALLTWKTATETNTSYYIVQRSNGSGSFAEVGRVGVHGAGYTYTFTDALPLANNASLVYYRLQSVDNNGAKTYSNTVSIDCSKKVSFAVFPNPAKSILNIKTDEVSANGLILITDQAGNAVYTNKIQNTQLQQVPVNGFAKGVYSVTIFTPSGKQTKQVVIE